MRIRFTSPHPKNFPDDLLALMKERPNIARTIHLPAQSGSVCKELFNFYVTMIKAPWSQNSLLVKSEDFVLYVFLNLKLSFCLKIMPYFYNFCNSYLKLFTFGVGRATQLQFYHVFKKHLN